MLTWYFSYILVCEGSFVAAKPLSSLALADELSSNAVLARSLRGTLDLALSRSSKSNPCVDNVCVQPAIDSGVLCLGCGRCPLTSAVYDPFPAALNAHRGLHEQTPRPNRRLRFQLERNAKLKFQLAYSTAYAVHDARAAEHSIRIWCSDISEERVRGWEKLTKQKQNKRRRGWREREKDVRNKRFGSDWLRTLGCGGFLFCFSFAEEHYHWRWWAVISRSNPYATSEVKLHPSSEKSTLLIYDFCFSDDLMGWAERSARRLALRASSSVSSCFCLGIVPLAAACFCLFIKSNAVSDLGDGLSSFFFLTLCNFSAPWQLAHNDFRS